MTAQEWATLGRLTRKIFPRFVAFGCEEGVGILRRSLLIPRKKAGVTYRACPQMHPVNNTLSACRRREVLFCALAESCPQKWFSEQLIIDTL